MANSASGESLIQRLVRILHAFDAEHPELTASELAARAGLSSSTAHRLAGDMAEEGLGGLYAAGLHLVQTVREVPA